MALPTALAPGFIRLRYTGTIIPHTQIIPINPASAMTPGVDPDLLTSGGTPVPFSTAIADYVDNTLAKSFTTDTAFGFAEIFAVDAVTGIRTFIYITNVGEVGDAVGPQVPLVEGVWVFKTTAGKPLKVYAMEGVYSRDVRNIGTVPADGRQAMVDFITGPTNFFYGRHNAWPLAFQTFTSKENDVLRRKSLLPAV